MGGGRNVGAINVVCAEKISSANTFGNAHADF